MIYKACAFRYMQHNQGFLSLILPFEVINKISKVLIYDGKDKYGYQRKLNKKHYMSISKNILEGETVLPTSIILSVDSSYISNCITNNSDKMVELCIDTDVKEFRIVDGQHRIKGMEEASKQDSSINQYMLNVIIMITEPNDRVKEVMVFRDINSLAKKVKIDLTKLAIYNYELILQKNITNIDEHISIKSAYYLNENFESAWFRAIKFDPNLENGLGIIGVSPFITSINNITKEFIKNDKYHSLDTDSLIQYTETKAQELASFINRAWDIVRNKWDYCFKTTLTRDIFEYITIFYGESYYIQKTTGSNAIHMILFDCIKEEGFNDDSLRKFESIIRKSKVKTDDWIIGGRFSGLTSGSGFKKAKDIILNKDF